MSAQAAGSLACLCMGSVVGAVPLELVRDGKSTASLVVAGDAPPTVARAAAELQEYVERSTGAPAHSHGPAAGRWDQRVCWREPVHARVGDLA